MDGISDGINSRLSVENGRSEGGGGEMTLTVLGCGEYVPAQNTSLSLPSLTNCGRDSRHCYSFRHPLYCFKWTTDTFS